MQGLIATGVPRKMPMQENARDFYKTPFLTSGTTIP
jgi:hypothetical protein